MKCEKWGYFCPFFSNDKKVQMPINDKILDIHKTGLFPLKEVYYIDGNRKYAPIISVQHQSTAQIALSQVIYYISMSLKVDC